MMESCDHIERFRSVHADICRPTSDITLQVIASVLELIDSHIMPYIRNDTPYHVHIAASAS